jgi:hypothetical protein
MAKAAVQEQQIEMDYPASQAFEVLKVLYERQQEYPEDERDFRIVGNTIKLKVPASKLIDLWNQGKLQVRGGEESVRVAQKEAKPADPFTEKKKQLVDTMKAGRPDQLSDDDVRFLASYFSGKLEKKPRGAEQTFYKNRLKSVLDKQIKDRKIKLD